jgi:hypothetical protein
MMTSVDCERHFLLFQSRGQKMAQTMLRTVIGRGLMTTALASVLLLAALPVPQALAWGRGGGHYYGGWSVGIGWWGPAAWGWPYGPYDAFPYPGAYPYPYTPSPVVVEQVVTPAAMPVPAPAPTPAVWYFCDKAQGYYPYVPTCAGGWRQVPAGSPVR